MPKRALPRRVHAAAHRCSQRVVRARLSSMYWRSDLDGAHSSKAMMTSAARVSWICTERSGSRATGSVEVRLEARALLGDLPALGEAVDLEPARVGEAAPGPRP
jgi:hypothetical protein